MALEPRHVIAESFVRKDARMPAKATLDKADRAIAALEARGWSIVKNGEFVRVTPDSADPRAGIEFA